MTDTIFALASAQGRAGIAAIRLSGPQAGQALIALTGSLPRPRYASLRNLTDPITGELLDCGLVLWFPAPASFTGEDVGELHLHGSRAVIADVLSALSALPGCRPARAGEFTRRAFDNGRLDLAAVEGLADLITAETTLQRRQALHQASGALGRQAEQWRALILSRLAEIEAVIDFADEAIPDTLEATSRAGLKPLCDDLARHLARSAQGERLRDGFRVTIFGVPNVGKSSLLNALAGRDVAIVSQRAGTTRDVIELHLDLAGYPVTITDTAGVSDTEDVIESEGIRRALACAQQADLVLLVADATLGHLPQQATAFGEENCLLIANKADLAHKPLEGFLAVSARTGQGIEALISAISLRAANHLSHGETSLLTRARHRHAVEAALAALIRASQTESIDFLAEDLRLAAREIGRIAGSIDVEDLLDCIFAEFCIGK